MARFAWRATIRTCGARGRRSKRSRSHEFVLGKRVFEDGAVEYKVSYTGLDDDHAHWEAAANLPKKAVDEYEEAHPHA